MPILLHESKEIEPQFYGAICLNHEPVGDLLGYFPIESDVLPKFVMFTADENYEEAARPLTILGIDLVRDQRRNRFLDKTSFYKDL